MKRIFYLFICGIFTLPLYSLSPGDYTPIQVDVRPWIRNDTNVQWRAYPTRIVENLRKFTTDTMNVRTRYGSDPLVRFRPSGFFRAEKRDDRWWMVDPEGFRHINLAVVGVRKGPGERNKTAEAAKFTDTRQWMEWNADMLFSLGFSGTGPWSDDKAIQDYNENHSERAISRCMVLNWMAKYGAIRGGIYRKPGNIGYPNESIFVFDPQFEDFCNKQAEKLLELSDDETIVGYFSDNELPFGLKNLEAYLSLPDAKDPGRIAAQEWIANRGISKDKITDSVRAEFAGLVAERYYRIVSNAFRRYDKNHMYLGSRLHGGAKFNRKIMEAAGRYCDVVSINFYGQWTPDAQRMEEWGEWTGKPFLITEFYTKGNDAGLSNITGAGFTVRTQQDRGYAYQHFTLGLLESRNCVGWHWFKYIDNDPTVSSDKVDLSNLNSNKGLVDNEYVPYKPLADCMKEMNRNVYRLADHFDGE